MLKSCQINFVYFKKSPKTKCVCSGSEAFSFPRWCRQQECRILTALNIWQVLYLVRYWADWKCSGTDHKIIIRKGTFVENFFDSSEVGVISKIRGKCLEIIPNFRYYHFFVKIFLDKLEPRSWDEGDPLYPEQMKTLVEDVLYK